MYKIGLRLREYQKDALDWALSREGSVVAMPTGTGKTLIGAAWAANLLNLGRASRILVLEPTRFLVEQVWRYYTKYTNIPATKIYGVIPKEFRAGLWDKGLVVVTTPQTAFNDINLLSFDAVIVDECHHTSGNHAYAKLIQNYDFKYKLGLTATVPDSLRTVISSFIGEIREWSWSDPKIRPYVPEWYGEVYDAELETDESRFFLELEELKKKVSRRQRGIISLAQRMFVRDGALALMETVNNSSFMSTILNDLKSSLIYLRPLHKLPQLEAVLSQHDFRKAIVFVDRVIIAKELVKKFKYLNPVLLLGRLHGSSMQREAIEEAKRDEVKLIVATSAGEEGIDIPVADLLVVWSNVVSPIRFIQRHGRIMRKTDEGKPKVAVYIATPDTPDYDALFMGLMEARKHGIDVLGLDEKDIVPGTTMDRIREALSMRPSTFNELLETLGGEAEELRDKLYGLIRAGVVSYFYYLDLDLLIQEFIRRMSSYAAKTFGISKLDFNNSVRLARMLSKSVLRRTLTFRLGIENRVYFLVEDVPLVLEEYKWLFTPTMRTTLEATFRIGGKREDKVVLKGNYDNIIEEIQSRFLNKYIYLTLTYKGTYSTLVTLFSGLFEADSIKLAVLNAARLASTLKELDKILTGEKTVKLNI